MQAKFILSSLFISLVLIGFSCKKNNTESNEIVSKIIEPIRLNAEQTIIYLDDFLADSIIVDSVIIDGQKADFYQNKKTILYAINPNMQLDPIVVMQVWIGGKNLDVMLKKSEEIPFLFLFKDTEHRHKTIELAGEFNGWTPSKTSLTFNDSLWGIRLDLNRGKYQYQVVIDGHWGLDPHNPDSIENGQGGYNSVLTIGSKANSEPIIWADAAEANKVILRAKNLPDKIYALWNNQLISSQRINVNNEFITISIPEVAKSQQISYLRVYSFNQFGIGNDLLIPLQNGEIITKPDLNNRFDHRQKIIYNVFMDRFVDGNPKNNKRLPDSIMLPAANYHGGDIAGMKSKIEDGYFKELGVNTLWMSPVVKNTDKAYGFWPEPKTKFSAYHGYWPISFTQIDSHFGTAKELQETVEFAHNHNINIIADYVANHIHEDHPFYKSNPNCATPLQLPDGRLNLELWDEHRLTTWFDKFLPTLDLENAEIANMVADSVVWWAQQYNLDGFRYDAAKHVPLSFWRLLTDKLGDNIKAVQQGLFYQLGETYGSAALIGSYLGAGLLDAQFDFNLYDAAVNAFAKGSSFTNLADRMTESMRNYGFHHSMGNITGNQDRGRFISYAGGSLLFSEDAKAAGWTRKIDVGDSIGYQKLAMLMAFNMTIPGIPVIYYGDEFGMAGGNDPDCRRMMRFGDDLSIKEQNNLLITKELIHIRKNSMALLYGDFCYMKAEKNLLIYARKYFGDMAIIAFNNSNEIKTVDLNISDFADNISLISYPKTNISLNDNNLHFELKPWSFVILRNN